VNEVFKLVGITLETGGKEENITVAQYEFLNTVLKGIYNKYILNLIKMVPGL